MKARHSARMIKAIEKAPFNPPKGLFQIKTIKKLNRRQNRKLNRKKFV